MVRRYLPFFGPRGILTAPSSQVAGLQLADALSFGIGRRFRRAEQFENDTATELDLAALGPIAALMGARVWCWAADNRGALPGPCDAESVLLAGEFFPATCIDVDKPGGVCAAHSGEGRVTLGVDGKNC